jgi:hypothetical protein
MKDDAVATMRIVWYGALALVFAVAITFVGWKLWPTQMAVERDAMQQSHQYTDAKRSMLLKMAEEYEQGETDIAKYRASDAVKFKDVIKGMETQQEALLARIRNEAKMIPASQVPDSVRKYLR